MKFERALLKLFCDHEKRLKAPENASGLFSVLTIHNLVMEMCGEDVTVEMFHLELDNWSSW